MNLEARHDRIILTLVKKPTSKGGIILPESDSDPWAYGKVAAIGPKVESVLVDDIILFYKCDGTPLKVDEDIYFTIRDSQVIGVYSGGKND